MAGLAEASPAQQRFFFGGKKEEDPHYGEAAAFFDYPHYEFYGGPHFLDREDYNSFSGSVLGGGDQQPRAFSLARFIGDLLGLAQ